MSDKDMNPIKIEIDLTLKRGVRVLEKNYARGGGPVSELFTSSY